MFDTEELSRHPTFFEEYYIARNLENKYGNVVVCGKYDGKIDDNLLSNALRGLILRHSIYSYNFYPSDGRGVYETDEPIGAFVFKQVPEIRLHDILTRTTVTTFDDDTLKELILVKIEIGSGLPLWRIQLIDVEEEPEDQYVVFICDHSIMDGRSSAKFHLDIIKELDLLKGRDQPSLSTLFNAVNDNDSLVLPLGVDSLTDLYRISFLYSFKGIIGAIAPKWLSYHYNRCFSPATPDFYKYPLIESETRSEDKSSVKLIQISDDLVSGLIRYCRKNGTTITPMLTAVALSCFQEFLGRKSTLKVEISLDGRGFDPELKDRYGVFVSSLSTLWSPDSDNDLSNALKIKKSLDENRASKDSFKQVSLLKLVDIRRYVKGRLGKRDARSFLEISNLGAVSIPGQSWRIKNLFFTQPNTMMTQTSLSVISVPNGGMSICASYLEKSFKASEMDRIAKMLVHRLRVLSTEL